MKKYTIIGGVNGTGKSSFTGVLKNLVSDLGVIIDVDKIAQEQNINNLESGKIAVRKMKALSEKGVCFTQETTLCSSRTERFARQMSEKGYYIRLYYIGLNSAEESLKRIKNRVEKGGHDIPRNDVTRRFDIRFENLINILPYCNEVHFYDNDNGFSEIAEYTNGEIITKVSPLPKWFMSFQEEYNHIQESENLIEEI